MFIAQYTCGQWTASWPSQLFNACRKTSDTAAHRHPPDSTTHLRLEGNIYLEASPPLYHFELPIAVPRQYYRSWEGGAVLSTAMIGRHARPQDEGMPILLGSGPAYLF